MGEASDPAQLAAVSTPASARRSLARLALAPLAFAAPFLASFVLLIYPWLDRWERNGLSAWIPAWSSGYLRGAVSGLGGVTLFLSLSSLARVRRKTPPA